MRIRCTDVATFAALLFSATACHAGELSIGYLSLDSLIPGAPGSPGVNTFTVGNLTGDPLNGGNDLPPTFPVLTPLTFKNSTLVLWSGNTSQTIDLGDIGPGFFNPLSLEFADTVLFSSAVFSATLDSTNLQLDGGGAVTLASPNVSASLLPSGGPTLAPGVDLVLLNVSFEAPAAVPEPASWTLLVIPLLFLWSYRSIASRRA